MSGSSHPGRITAGERTKCCVFMATMAIMTMCGAPARAQVAPPLANVVENFAQAIVGTRRCPRYGLNVALMTMASLRLGLDLEEPRIKNLFDERVTFHAARVAARSEADLCDSLGRHFGPGGDAVPDLVVARTR